MVDGDCAYHKLWCVDRQHPADLLKLFLCGYFNPVDIINAVNRVRSSRHLKRECRCNLEVKWLLRELTPDHNTIAAFRKKNPKAIREVFRATVKAAQHFKLIGGKLLTVFSTNLRAKNSKTNNYNIKKADRHMAYIDAQLVQFFEGFGNGACGCVIWLSAIILIRRICIGNFRLVLGVPGGF